MTPTYFGYQNSRNMEESLSIYGQMKFVVYKNIEVI